MKVGVIMYQTSLSKGQELVAQRMVKEFRRQGHESYLITSVYHDREPVPAEEEIQKLGYLLTYDEKTGIPTVRVNSRFASWPPRRISFVDFPGVLTKVASELKLDVLITHSTLWNGPEDVAKYVEWVRNQIKQGAPVRPVIFCHMSHFQEPTEGNYDMNERTYREAWNSVTLPVILRAADYVLVTTPYEEEAMKKAGADGSKLVLFPGGVDYTLVSFPGRGSADIRSKYGLPPGKKLLTFLGTVEERKNVGRILDVCESLKEREDFHFVIAGTLEGEYAENVKRRTLEMANISVLGTIPEEDVPALAEESYANVILSRAEALGMAQIEFMFAGTPVVTSGVGGQAWLVKDGTNGLVVSGPDDVAGAARAVWKLLDDPRFHDRLGRKAMESASDFTMPNLIHRLLKRLNARLAELKGSSQDSIEPGEKVIEAWVRKGYRVAVTTGKLVVVPRGARKNIAIPFDQLRGASRVVRRPWLVFALGAVMTAVWLWAGTGGTPGEPYVRALSDWLAGQVSSTAARAAPAILPFVPLAIAVAAFFPLSQRGYSVKFGDGGSVYLPADFTMALRMSDEMTPWPLFQRKVEEA
ncbi:MAG: glycosyltransferase family 4 protein [Thaumarchaeota archaeon]|nr:glycosyltransferase family 4 protein [Nitrososphaerota archaeon]